MVTSPATRRGWLSGRSWTAVPVRTRLVREAIQLAISSGADSTERAGLTIISAIQTMSSPQASALSASVNISRNASAWVFPRLICSMKIPKSMPVPPREVVLRYSSGDEGTVKPGSFADELQGAGPARRLRAGGEAVLREPALEDQLEGLAVRADAGSPQLDRIIVGDPARARERPRQIGRAHV